MDDRTLHTVLRAGTLGTVAGIRSMSAPALASFDATYDRRDLDGTPFALMATERVSSVLALMALGEMVADKLPFLPNRTDPLPLLGRMVFGGVAGATVFAGEGLPPAAGAAISGAVAIASSQATYRIRRALNSKIPNVLSGLLGDIVVFAFGSAFLRSR